MATATRIGLAQDDDDRRIHAIETIYQRNRFRSRLEAQWAVFYDRLGIRWVYEAQGYRDMFNEKRYLPDFFVPDFEVYVEIKPLNGDSHDQRTTWLAHTGDRPVLTLFGRPGSPNQVKYQARDVSIAGADLYECSGISSRDQQPCGGLVAIVTAVPAYVVQQIGDHRHHELSIVWAEHGHRRRLETAFQAACGARFEHGERGEDRLIDMPPGTAS